ncbi:MAG: DUF4129 domain-containing protein [Anaerolineae bacterium]|nr:DUF4129 domain-containing protein [Anaerolineae bacterium]
MHRALLFLLLVTLFLAGPAVAQEAISSPSLDAYLALAAETEAALTGADGEAITALAARWEGITVVVLPTGAEVAVDHTALVAALRAEPRDDAALAARLATLQSVAARWAGPAYDQAAAAGATARLEAILARSAFQWEEQQPTFWERLWQRILRLLFELIPFGDSALDLANVILAVSGAAILFLALALAARSLLRTIRPEAAADSAPGDEHGLTAEQALRHAEANSQQGDYRSAVRYLYLSTLLLLEEHGVLRYDRSRTNREYLRTVAGMPELYATLHSVVDVFDRVWYGFQPLDEAGYAQYERQVNALRRRRPATHVPSLA